MQGRQKERWIYMVRHNLTHDAGRRGFW